MIHNAFRPLCLPVLLAMGLLAGCSHQASCGDSHPYLANTERAPLAAPDGVSVPAPDAAYVVPAVKPGLGQAGNCMIRPPDVLGPLGAASAASQVAPTITRHRHGEVIQEGAPPPPTKPTTAPSSGTRVPPAAATRAAPAVATRPPME